jgi:DMSO reductase family type II enzyme iron-sulfur subunit
MVVRGQCPRPEDFGGGWQFNHEEVFFGGHGRSVHLQARTEVRGIRTEVKGLRTEAKGLRTELEEATQSSVLSPHHSPLAPSWGPNWDEDQGGGEFPNAYYFYLPRLCNHCTRPACVEACPTGAMYKRSADGIVLRNEAACRGFRACMEACPYKKIYFNYVTNVAQHCILCFPRLEQGIAPACARSCPGRLVFVGYLDDTEGPIHKLVNEWGVALPLHPEYGTQPNVFYVPPMSPYRLNDDRSIDYSTPRIPPAYLESLFGPRVHAALATLRDELATVRAGGRSAILDTLIVYHWQELFGPFTNAPAAVGSRHAAGEEQA